MWQNSNNRGSNNGNTFDKDWSMSVNLLKWALAWVAKWRLKGLDLQNYNLKKNDGGKKEEKKEKILSEGDAWMITFLLFWLIH